MCVLSVFLRFAMFLHSLPEKLNENKEGVVFLSVFTFVKMKINVREMCHGSDPISIEFSHDGGIITVGELRVACADALKIKTSRTKMFLRGTALNDDSERAHIRPNDTILVTALQYDRARGTSDVRGSGTSQGNQGGKSSSNNNNKVQMFLFRVLSKRQVRGLPFLSLACSRYVITNLCSAMILKVLVYLSVWSAFARLAYEIDFGPVFVLLTAFFLIFANLSSSSSYSSSSSSSNRNNRFSAYSIFNPNFEQLPGTFDAAQVERNIRHDYHPSEI